MIRRTLEKKLLQASRQFPVITVTGPRQSGKTTLVRGLFSRHEYVSLEEPDHRDFALRDPRGFLGQFRGPVILNEVQRAPELFSYLQRMVDEKGDPGRFILTGSQNFLLLQSVSQTLAGRSAILHLLPFSLSELREQPGIPLDSLGKPFPHVPPPRENWVDVLFKGFYPRIHDKRLNPRDWLGSYYQAYLERDVRHILNVGDLRAFGRFIGLCAGRSGQLLNLSSLAADCGITHTTASRWLSILEASFLVLLLKSHHRNFRKRLVKAPKLYFLDTGLLCFLLGIREPRELHQHPHRGALFESFVVAEIHKAFVHQGEIPRMDFWRDSTGHEVDLLVGWGKDWVPVEVKSGQTVAEDFFGGIQYWRKLSGRAKNPAALVYGGDRPFERENVAVYPWFYL